jgi:ABC-type methionine transport system ATPase subunit
LPDGLLLANARLDISRKEANMGARILRLVYPPALISKPILYQLIKRFQIEVNIREAHITLEEGWLEVELNGETKELNRAVQFLEEKVIEVINQD